MMTFNASHVVPSAGRANGMKRENITVRPFKLVIRADVGRSIAERASWINLCDDCVPKSSLYLAKQ